MFEPWTIPSGELSGLMPAGTELAEPAIFQKIQWVTSIEFFIGAASVSCMMTAKLWAAAGALLQESSGEAALGSAQEYCVGIIEPSAYAEVDSLNLDGGGGACCCAAATAAPARSAHAKIVKISVSLVRI